MRLIFTCGNLRSGGAERVISILANKFVQKDIEVDLYTWYKTDIFYDFDEKVKIHQIPIESGKNDFFRQMRWFRQQVLKTKPDVVLSFLAPFNILTVFSTFGLKILILVAERNDPKFVSPSFNGFWKIFRNIAYYMADGVLVQTKVNQSHFPGYIRKKSTIIYNPVIFSKDKIGIALNQEKRKEIVSVTRLQRQKNVGMLIDAFALFLSSHPGYKLIIYGEGAERKALEKKISDMQLLDSVFLPGRKQNVHELIIGAEIFAMASNFEGMSNSLIEAMCLGLPCISTKVSGATDLIESGNNGLLVELNDTEGMCAALCSFADDKSKAKTMGRNATELYKILDVDVIAEQWLGYIEKYIT